VGEIFRFINQDFQENGQEYMATRLSTRQYQQQIKQKHTFPEGTFDLDYYLESFYTYAIVKQHFMLTGRFEHFNKLINGWKSGPQTFFYPATEKTVKTGWRKYC
jgi:hypothetical protein